VRTRELSGRRSRRDVDLVVDVVVDLVVNVDGDGDVNLAGERRRLASNTATEPPDKSV
jgi:hypothetical protein